jgi:tetratricopeptide (TPR) repeat protein
VLNSRDLDARLSLRAWADRLCRSRLDDPRLSQELDRIDSVLPDLSLPERARLLVARAQIRIGLLDRRGTHSDLLDTLASRPHPSVECQAHLLRVRLLDAVEPMSAWHEALRCIEIARGHGLLGAEVLAWGLAGLHMSRLGYGEEALARVESGVRRLQRHGDIQLANEARLHLGRILSEQGRTEEAREAWSHSMDLLPGQATLALRGRELLALHAILSGDSERAHQLASSDLPTPAIRQIWSMIRACITLAQGSLPMLPGPDVLDRTAAIGRYGIALGLLLADSLQSSQHTSLANLVRERIQKSCRERSLSLKDVQRWMKQFTT